MTKSNDELNYLLSRHIPDMSRGFQINTNYGCVDIDADDAQPFIAALEALIKKAKKSNKEQE